MESRSVPKPPNRARRYRSSTSASTPPTSTKATEVLQGLLDRVATVLRAHLSPEYPDTALLVKLGRQIHQHVAATNPPCPAQDDFRHLSGYQNMLNVLRAYSGFYNPQKRNEEEKKGFFELLHIMLAIFSATFRAHQGNRRYFKHKVEGAGWEALEQIIASVGLGGSDSDLWTNCQLFGKLLSFSLDDQRLDELCQAVAATSVSQHHEDNKDAEKEEVVYEKDDGDQITLFDAVSIEGELKKIIGSNTVILNPEILRAVVDFWESIPRDAELAPNLASVLVLTTLASVSSASFYNLSALHGTGVLSRFIRVYFTQDSRLTQHERAAVLGLCKSLMHLGVDRLADAQLLLSSQDSATSQFCLEMAEKYHGPPFVQFDLSLHGHSSIELPSLGRSFPPQSSSAGYTFTAWIRIDKFDPDSHTTLFGVFDATQTCFLLAYLERDTHNFILQTSVTSQRPSVRFKSVKFKEGQWYHIALVHRRPKTMTASKASLYVNGEFEEQIRSQYPVHPPLTSGSTESFASFSSTGHKTHPVQAFLGTPRDLSTKLGPGLVFSKWSLASAHLFEEVLSDDFIAVHFRLGPRYQGNFQDCLGGFQTYDASSALGLRNELLHPGKEESSDILKAIRDKASTIVPEQKILMSTLPTAIFRTDGQFLESFLFRSLSRNAASNLFQLTTKSGTAVAINSALPCVNDALVRVHGVAVLSGDPVLATPYNFDDNLWRLGGFTPVVLKLVERTTKAEDFLRAMELMFLCINKSWRNSEAMERDNGYSILGMLIRAKLGYVTSGSDIPSWRLLLTPDERDKLSFQLLSLILGFVGYQHANSVESFIINPLAYRILLIDFDTWRRSAAITQELYYKQFVTFAVESKYHQFNSRRLLRMRIVKRLLDALKAELISEEIMPHFLKSFETLVKCSFNAEVHRSMALFITYAFHSSSSSLSRTPRPSSAASSAMTRSGVSGLRRTTITSADSANGSNLHIMTKKQVGVKILDLYTRLLCHKGSLNDIRKFARTVTNKWLLYLLAEENPEVVVNGCKIIARLLVSHGSGYTSKFASKTGGFWIMAHRLKHWWDISTLWPICFGILFGYDVAEMNFSRPFDLANLTELFGKCRVAYPDVLPVITTLLQHGLRDILKYQDDPDSPVGGDQGPLKSPSSSEPIANRSRARSMNFLEELGSRQTRGMDKDRVASHAVVLQTVVRFLADLHNRSAEFRDFALNSDYVRLLLSALYPVIVSTDPVNPETELHSKDSALTFEGGDVIIRPLAGSSSPAPIVRTSVVSSTEVSTPSPLQRGRGTQLRRASSFVLLTAQESPQAAKSSARLAHVMSPRKQVEAQMISNVVLEGLLDLVINIFTDQILARKDFPGFGLFLKVPPGFQEHQAYFESYVLRNMISHLGNVIQSNQKVLCETKVLTNMSRFALHKVDAIFEGWFMNGADPMMDFIGTVLEYLRRPEISSIKSVRLCSQNVATLRTSFVKLILLRLSDVDDAQVSEADALSVLEKLFYWQTVLLDCLSAEDDFMKLLWYQLYAKLIDAREPIRLAAAGIWRIMLVQKPEDCSRLFRECMLGDQSQLTKGFKKLTEVDDGTFVVWIDQHRPSLDALFLGGMSKTWEDYVNDENQRTLETARTRLSRRKDRLRQWHGEGMERENVLLRHEMANSAWMKSIFFTEHFKYQRLTQDQQDDFVFLVTSFAKMDRDLKRPGGVFADTAPVMKWKLDRTEGRNRMRLRLLPDTNKLPDEYQPKQQAKKKPSEPVPNIAGLRLDTKIGPGTSAAVTLLEGVADVNGEQSTVTSEQDAEAESGVAPEDDFELIDDPNEPEGDDAFEDKNRKVMRRLEAGDTVQNVYNISRIIGLEACEGILIIGKEALYIMDNVFRSPDGEIINVWQAPPEDRDPYSQIITGNKTSDRPKERNRNEQESRSWRWHDVISISKRRFLFRDVAIEIFFTDGRSYLLTALNANIRDEVYSRLMNKTPHTSDPKSLPNPEDAWRLEALKVFDEAPQSFGSKFGSIFNASPWNPIMRRWQKGEISNFHYLMLVNTMAGRTFNDLTQYPVFPWVLADYTSEELDLRNPATFRDLSKPMGAQTTARQTDYILRYSSLAEMDQIPFHYGTHYSSAMVVASYLIRLPPFVKSYILLQGGTFDHPDRMFYSIDGAWKSASHDNGTDVRELTPEFFYLPDFLTNINGYNFGVRQGTGGSVDNVILPPWAKGDPKIFIAKHREALESPYVTQNLHNWIDLIFGFKQKGEAAVENLNVFHNLSYHGAIDLDNIVDQQERKITTSIIHNFGQTPHQVFPKPHPAREHAHCPIKRLDSSVHALTKISYPLLESHERVASLIYASKLDRLLCSSPFRINMPPHFDKFLEWGFADNSVRFFLSDNRKPAGLFENLHQGQISCVAFADSKTLITAGEDSVVSVFAIKSAPGKNVELLPRLSLFGHKTPVNTIAVSKAFSTFVTVSQDGTAFLWDLNRLEFIRKLPVTRPVECARINDVSGEIMLCSGPYVLLFNLNGELIIEQNVCLVAGNVSTEGGGSDDYVYSCAFYSGAGSEWLENFLVFTGHRRGRVNIWRKTVTRNGKWVLEFMRRLDHADNKSESGANVEAPITCITPMPQIVYTGDDDGKVYEWNLVQRER